MDKSSDDVTRMPRVMPVAGIVLGVASLVTGFGLGVGVALSVTGLALSIVSMGRGIR